MATGNLGCVVVAVDSSAESMKALRWALDNLRLSLRPSAAAAAAAAGDDASPATANLGVLIILHVQSPVSIVTSLNQGFIPFVGPSDVDVPVFSAAIEAHQRQITGAILKHALDICAGRNVNVRTKVVVGNPKVKICEATVNSHADLLVMGCRSLGPIKRMFLGSVSNHCINHVSCPVLVIRGTS